jgi:hypothetical protein
MIRTGRLRVFYLLPYCFIFLTIVNANDVSDMLYSILVFTSAVCGALNLHLYLKQRHSKKECQNLKSENKELMKELNDLYNKYPVIKNDTRAKK